MISGSLSWITSRRRFLFVRNPLIFQEMMVMLPVLVSFFWRFFGFLLFLLFGPCDDGEEFLLSLIFLSERCPEQIRGLGLLERSSVPLSDPVRLFCRDPEEETLLIL